MASHLVYDGAFREIHASPVIPHRSSRTLGRVDD